MQPLHSLQAAQRIKHTCHVIRTTPWTPAMHLEGQATCVWVQQPTHGSASAPALGCSTTQSMPVLANTSYPTTSQWACFLQTAPANPGTVLIKPPETVPSTYNTYAQCPTRPVTRKGVLPSCLLCNKLATCVQLCIEARASTQTCQHMLKPLLL
jgi:hypothetical protein